VLRKGFGQYLDAKRSGVEHRMVGRVHCRQGDGVDELGLLEGMGWLGTRERRDPVAGLGRGPVRGMPAAEPDLGSGAVAPEVGVAGGIAGRIQEQGLVGHIHLMVSLQQRPVFQAYIAEASAGELYASLHTASLPC